MSHFSRLEMQCHCGCERCEMDPRFSIILESLRVQFGKPMKINSGFRCQKYNASLKDSSPKSKHLYGMAADISCLDATDRFNIIRLAISCGFNGIGIAKDFIHLDSRLDSRKIWVYPL